MAESIIDGIRRYIAACPLMSEFDSKRRHIDWMEADNENYGIYPDGDSLVDKYIDGTQIRQYACQITVRRFAKTDAERLKNSEFSERLQNWFGVQAEKNNLPELPENCIAEEIRAENAMLSELDITGSKGTYIIQIILRYTRED